MCSDGTYPFCCEIEHEAPAHSGPAVGIDRGVANTLALSTGERLSLPASLEVIERRKQKSQRILARRKRGSRRYAKARRRVANLAARAARIRRDWHHKAALNIARRFGVVVIEELKIQNMTASARGTVAEPGRHVRQKAGLNRRILEQGWGGFATILGYKLNERGGTLETVPSAYTSQTCPACGWIDRRNRKSRAEFACVECGHQAHADTNAAAEILRRNTALMRVEDRRRPADEARTIQGLFLGNPRPSGRGGC